MNRSRMPLVHDRPPHEARDADAVSAAPNNGREGTLVVASERWRTALCVFPARPSHSALSALGPWPADTGKRLAQLPDAGSPPRRAAAPHGPQFRLLVLEEDED